MLFTTVAATLLGLSALVSAAPHPKEDLSPAARGLTWSPKDKQLQKKSNFFDDNEFDHSFFSSEEIDVQIDIVDTVINLDESDRQSEEEFILLFEAKIDIHDGYGGELRDFRDNVRRNHYSNHFSNDFIVLIVITEIIDIRIESQPRTRYATRGISIGDSRRGSRTTIEVVEVVVQTIDSGFSQSFFQNYAPTGTASAGGPIQTVESSAPYLQSNQTQILPQGISYPRFGDIQEDPARIVEFEQIDIFVEIIESSNSNSNDFSNFGSSGGSF